MRQFVLFSKPIARPLGPIHQFAQGGQITYAPEKQISIDRE